MEEDSVEVKDSIDLPCPDNPSYEVSIDEKQKKYQESMATPDSKLSTDENAADIENEN